jgi:tetratricopeptide (TPR) repeat protein
VAGRLVSRSAGVLAVFLAAAAAGRPTEQRPQAKGEYGRLVARYRAGDEEAARSLATAFDSGAPWPRGWCHGREECEAEAVLDLDAASLLYGAARGNRAAALIDSTYPLVNRQRATFALDWLLAAGSLHQAYADHARAFGLYAAALELRPRDPSALLARATALEVSVIPDGFGAVVVSDRDVWRLLEPGGEPPRELSFQLANPRTETPYRRLLLELLTRQYRDVLDLDPARTEARLRLGRVLEARGHRADAEIELRAVAAGTGDPFLVAVARLCLARLASSPEGAAAAYRSALEVDPALSPAWLGLSQALYASGDRPGALEALERALSPDPPRELTAWVEYHLGRGRAFPEALARLRAGLAPPG